MYIGKTQIIYTLLAFLAVFYAINIFFTGSIIANFVDNPVKLSFVVLEAPQEECQNCFDGNDVIKMIDSVHNIKYKTSIVPYNSALSRKNIEMYDIKSLPAVIVSGDVSNEKMIKAWKAFSGTVRNKNILIENLLPYYELESGTQKGIVDAIIIKDQTCEDCFDGNTYIDILTQFGIMVNDVKTYDIASPEGKKFVQKYSITKVPMLILSPDAGDYAAFEPSWEDVGTIEEGGWYVFREVQKLKLKYKNI